jgi:hypothetical protein
VVTELFNLWDIMVNQVFGSPLIAIIGIAGILAIICFMSKLSSTFILFWISIFVIAISIVFIGPILLYLGLAGAFVYFAMALHKVASGGQT